MVKSTNVFEAVENELYEGAKETVEKFFKKMNEEEHAHEVILKEICKQLMFIEIYMTGAKESKAAKLVVTDIALSMLLIRMIEERKDG
jgi:hypothetical protein